MQPQTGAIAYFEFEEDAKKVGYTIKLKPAEAEKLCPTNRKERRAALAQMRREQRRKK